MLSWVCERRCVIPPGLAHLFVLVGLDGSVVPLTQVKVVPLTHRGGEKTRPLTATKLAASQPGEHTSFLANQRTTLLTHGLHWRNQQIATF